ncbi:LPS-assembly protein LptD [Sphingomonas sp. AX6]|uniref:LPS-assembly protein LptD n=1 Tax=Sphingomonas sp. AX6 TaxID=2653171 RepID=UPI0012EEFF57|nr:LPS assembly protein LptD [Sphingomonas sp. AX6]VXC97005.1 LPS-assembly protein LptD [Sphingomonas sp. AX6]
MKRNFLLSSVLPVSALLWCAPGYAQDLQDRPVDPPVPTATTQTLGEDEIEFSAGVLEYDSNSEVVTATSDVRLFRRGERLRADRVVWNRETGQVVAEGNIAVTNPQGDVAYGDRIELTDSLRDGVVENMLVVLEQGGRLAARRGERVEGGVINVQDAAYTPCAVTTPEGCPKEPTFKIEAVRVVYDPNRERVSYSGARFTLFGLSIPLPSFSHTIGDGSQSGLLAPSLRLDRVNGLEASVPYFWSFGPNRDLTLTPHVFTNALPMLKAEYRELNELGAFRVTGYGTYSRRADDFLVTPTDADTENAFRGFIDASGRYQFDPNWSASGSIRLASDQTFLRRYDISREDRLRNNVKLERIDRDSYFAIQGWAVQTMRIGENSNLQPIALPEIDYRRRIDGGIDGARVMLQLNTLALTRIEGQDTQRAFASAQWDWRRITTMGQEVTLTGYARGDVYNTNDTLSTVVPSYRGDEGFSARAIGAVALDVKWPFIGQFLGGTQRLTPRVQIVASPKLANLKVPNEDARAVDLEDSNLFALNRFPGYDRFEDSPRITYGADWAVDLPGFSLNATIGQSYRLSTRETLLPSGTGLDDRWSDFVGRTEVRWREFVSFTHRYRLDKDGFAIRRNEVDATVGTRRTYASVGYLRLNRDIDALFEDLQDREEVRVGGRVQVARYWSVFASAIVDLTDREEDPLSLSDGFDPIRHRLGVAYDDDCLTLGLTWKRDYEDTGDARRGNSFLLTLAFKNLGR